MGSRVHKTSGRYAEWRKKRDEARAKADAEFQERQRNFELATETRLRSLSFLDGTAVAEQSVPQSGPDYASLSRDELRDFAAVWGIKGRGRMSKKELIEALSSVR